MVAVSEVVAVISQLKLEAVRVEHHCVVIKDFENEVTVAGITSRLQNSPERVKTCLKDLCLQNEAK